MPPKKQVKKKTPSKAVKGSGGDGGDGNANGGSVRQDSGHGGFQPKKKIGETPATALFSVRDEVGSLTDALAVFKRHNINLTRIESRPSLNPNFDYDFFVDFVGTADEKLVTELKEKIGAPLRLLDGDKTATGGSWFPRKISDLDVYANQILEAGDKLQSDHPGFSDPVYRARRSEIAKIAKEYRHGQKIPRIDYTDAENNTWSQVYKKLKSLHPTHACSHFRKVFPLLEKHAGYSADKIPQLQDISDFLHSVTGFTLRPVAGLLSSRDFLNGLAFRVFHSTQYIRHASKPFYTPEPDVVHEVLGHVPLFADPSFAEFSQTIGLASLGASDDFVLQLATVYWFTVEFGLTREANGDLRAFGAGLLSSFGELEYCLSDKPKLLSFDPFVAGKQEYPITTYQPLYFVCDSFEEAKRKVREFAASSDRPFEVRYNPYTQSIDVLDSKEKVVELAAHIMDELTCLKKAVALN